MNQMRRRDVLRGLGAACAALGLGGAGLVSLPGCGVYDPESGDAFEPWRYPGDETVPERLVARAALLASSPHNTQPWALAIRPEAIELRARFDRNLGAMDSLLREMHVGLGCAVENMVVAARAVGRTASVVWTPDSADAALVARVALAPGPVDRGALFDAIPNRHTNRGRYLDKPASAGLRDALAALVDDPNVRLDWFATDAERARFREETIAATQAITEDVEMTEAGHAWYRHGKEEIAAERDGTTLDATGIGAATRTLGKAFPRPTATSANGYWLAGTKDRQTTGSAFAVLSSSPANTRVEQLVVGRIYERMHLWATLQGLGMQPLNQLAERIDREETAKLDPRFTRAMAALLGSPRRAQMIFRIGYPWDDAFASPRRPLEWVLS